MLNNRMEMNIEYNSVLLKRVTIIVSILILIFAGIVFTSSLVFAQVRISAVVVDPIQRIYSNQDKKLLSSIKEDSQVNDIIDIRNSSKLDEISENRPFYYSVLYFKEGDAENISRFAILDMVDGKPVKSTKYFFKLKFDISNSINILSDNQLSIRFSEQTYNVLKYFCNNGDDIEFQILSINELQCMTFKFSDIDSLTYSVKKNNNKNLQVGNTLKLMVEQQGNFIDTWKCFENDKGVLADTKITFKPECDVALDLKLLKIENNESKFGNYFEISCTEPNIIGSLRKENTGDGIVIDSVKNLSSDGKSAKIYVGFTNRQKYIEFLESNSNEINSVKYRNKDSDIDVELILNYDKINVDHVVELKPYKGRDGKKNSYTFTLDPKPILSKKQIEKLEERSINYNDRNLLIFESKPDSDEFLKFVSLNYEEFSASISNGFLDIIKRIFSYKIFGIQIILIGLILLIVLILITKVIIKKTRQAREEQKAREELEIEEKYCLKSNEIQNIRDDLNYALDREGIEYVSILRKTFLTKIGEAHKISTTDIFKSINIFIRENVDQNNELLSEIDFDMNLLTNDSGLSEKLQRAKINREIIYQLIEYCKKSKEAKDSVDFPDTSGGELGLGNSESDITDKYINTLVEKISGKMKDEIISEIISKEDIVSLSESIEEFKKLRTPVDHEKRVINVVDNDLIDKIDLVNENFRKLDKISEEAQNKADEISEKKTSLENFQTENEQLLNSLRIENERKEKLISELDNRSQIVLSEKETLNELTEKIKSLINSGAEGRKKEIIDFLDQPYDQEDFEIILNKYSINRPNETDKIKNVKLRRKESVMRFLQSVLEIDWCVDKCRSAIDKFDPFFKTLSSEVWGFQKEEWAEHNNFCSKFRLDRCLQQSLLIIDKQKFIDQDNEFMNYQDEFESEDSYVVTEGLTRWLVERFMIDNLDHFFLLHQLLQSGYPREIRDLKSMPEYFMNLEELGSNIQELRAAMNKLLIRPGVVRVYKDDFDELKNNEIACTESELNKIVYSSSKGAYAHAENNQVIRADSIRYRKDSVDYWNSKKVRCIVYRKDNS